MLLRISGADRTRTPGGISVEVRRIAIAIGGFSVLMLGLALIVVPVPGTSIVVIPLGFAILAKEFVWAKRTLAWSRRLARAFWTSVRQHLAVLLSLLFHDENGDGKLDTNFVGIPREGVGVSNNKFRSLGPPSWDDAKFALKGDLVLDVTLHY